MEIYNRKNDCWSLQILVPFRKEAVEEYMDDLKAYKNVKFKNNLAPVTFSFGYKMTLG
jgi:hypothetical protein